MKPQHHFKLYGSAIALACAALVSAGAELVTIDFEGLQGMNMNAGSPVPASAQLSACTEVDGKRADFCHGE